MMIQSLENGRKEDGNRSIADKIIKRLDDLSKTVQNNQGRWAWELLQNAKDSIAEVDNKTVSVRLELDENHVKFSHNGIYFTELDIRGLINQISSKGIEEGQQTRKERIKKASPFSERKETRLGENKFRVNRTCYSWVNRIQLML